MRASIPIGIPTNNLKSEAAVNVVANLGAESHRVGVSMASSLYSAAVQGDADVVTALLEAGASVDAVDKQGLTPLHCRCRARPRRRRAGAARGGRQRGCGRQSRVTRRCTALQIKATQTSRGRCSRRAPAWMWSTSRVSRRCTVAAGQGHADVARALLEAGASVDAVGKEGARRCTALQIKATQSSRGRCSRRAPAWMRSSKEGLTPLHCRCRSRPRRRRAGAARGGRQRGCGRQAG